MRPILDERDAGAWPSGSTSASNPIDAMLAKYRQGDGFVLYDTVTEPQRQELSRPIDALSKEVSQVQGVIAPQ